MMLAVDGRSQVLLLLQMNPGEIKERLYRAVSAMALEALSRV